MEHVRTWPAVVRELLGDLVEVRAPEEPDHGALLQRLERLDHFHRDFLLIYEIRRVHAVLWSVPLTWRGTVSVSSTSNRNSFLFGREANSGETMLYVDTRSKSYHVVEVMKERVANVSEFKTIVAGSCPS
jgi:hypothetical protein